ncbi:MAG: tyrosine--tRNA ligase, partial [Bradymonadaceae bacterium]
MSYDSAALAELDWRGLIDDLSAEELDEALGDGSVSFYCGFDPTSDSLQVGNLLPVMVMAHLYRQGHRPVALAGGATGRIGDPSGRSSERDLLGDEELERNLSAISSQLESIFERALTFRSERASRAEGDGDVAVRNNDEWLGEFRYVDFLRDVGKHFRVNKMINKESVRSRLEDRDQGISYTEFSYMLLQAYDFLHLYREEDCRLQVGGSDQWGNITAGIDLVRRKEGEEVFGLTAPLVTTPAGEKLGKTADGTVWLDPEKTSPYEFYQYWIRRRDGEMPELLRMFTFLPEEEVVELSEFAQSDEHRGEVQERLALEVTKLV